jgi:hypothetical protein
VVGACGERGEDAARPALDWLTPADAVALEPGACTDTSGRTWVAWLDWRPVGVRLLVDLVGRDAPLELAAGPALARPQLAPLESGVYCVWETLTHVQMKKEPKQTKVVQIQMVMV